MLHCLQVVSDVVWHGVEMNDPAGHWLVHVTQFGVDDCVHVPLRY